MACSSISPLPAASASGTQSAWSASQSASGSGCTQLVAQPTTINIAPRTETNRRIITPLLAATQCTAGHNPRSIRNPSAEFWPRGQMRIPPERHSTAYDTGVTALHFTSHRRNLRLHRQPQGFRLAATVQQIGSGSNEAWFPLFWCDPDCNGRVCVDHNVSHRGPDGDTHSNAGRDTYCNASRDA